MIPAGVQIFLALEPIDLRWSFERLSGVVQETIGYDVRSGALFVFYGRRKGALKILFFDGSGMTIFYKRFDRAIVRIPTDLPPNTTRVELDDASLEALIDGIELEEKPASKRQRAVH
jgi:transposase